MKAVAKPRRLHAFVLAGALISGCVGPAPPTEAPPVPVVEEPSPPPPTPQMVAREPAPPVVSEPPPPPVSALPPLLPPVNEEDSQALSLLTDLHKIAAASPEEAKRDLAVLSQAVTRPRSDPAKVKLALLLTLPAAGATDEARAITLLEQVIGKSPGATPTRQVAALLHAVLTEHQRSLREEQKKAEGLQQKLDALKSVERSLLGRDRRSPAPSTRAPSSNSK